MNVNCSSICFSVMFTCRFICRNIEPAVGTVIGTPVNEGTFVCISASHVMFAGQLTPVFHLVFHPPTSLDLEAVRLSLSV